jgi:hypothetical protein
MEGHSPRPTLDYRTPTPPTGRSVGSRLSVLIFFAIIGGIAACILLILAYWYTGAGLQMVD